jgi:hypothetical protein
MQKNASRQDLNRNQVLNRWMLYDFNLGSPTTVSSVGLYQDDRSSKQRNRAVRATMTEKEEFFESRVRSL